MGPIRTYIPQLPRVHILNTQHLVVTMYNVHPKYDSTVDSLYTVLMQSSLATPTGEGVHFFFL